MPETDQADAKSQRVSPACWTCAYTAATMCIIILVNRQTCTSMDTWGTRMALATEVTCETQHRLAIPSFNFSYAIHVSSERAPRTKWQAPYTLIYTSSLECNNICSMSVITISGSRLGVFITKKFDRFCSAFALPACCSSLLPVHWSYFVVFL